MRELAMAALILFAVSHYASLAISREAAEPTSADASEARFRVPDAAAADCVVASDHEESQGSGTD